jgi:S1-C subfamily serine protease
LVRNGLRPGDVISGVNRQRINNLAELQRALAASGRSIYLQILRNGSIYTARID